MKENDSVGSEKWDERSFMLREKLDKSDWVVWKWGEKWFQSLMGQVIL